jgi:hypothetical protein
MDMDIDMGVGNHGRNMNMAMSRSMDNNMNTMNSMSAALGMSGIHMSMPIMNTMPMNSMSAALGMQMNLPASSSIISRKQQHSKKQKPSRRIASSQHEHEHDYYELDLDTLAPAAASNDDAPLMEAGTDGGDSDAGGVYDPMEALMPHTRKRRAPAPHHSRPTNRKKQKRVNAPMPVVDCDCDLALHPPPSMPCSTRDPASETSTMHRYLEAHHEHDDSLSNKSRIISQMEHEQGGVWQGNEHEQEQGHELGHQGLGMDHEYDHNKEEEQDHEPQLREYHHSAGWE